ncbi:hypothetical protein MOQ_005394 [Trypanosoma cruzi marinkellei]|uniref:Target of rapamycin (TOR) kinase 1 n=1 Tax=Trypanosoma cruzi marinkellei TaxID=85056 RepID=K2MYA5_TRYCR|nr:hypothetical protein MOQ_005394 [Trypanosoma cruzi marinkellei]
MPRGGRHAGVVDTAANGMQSRPRNSPDCYSLNNCRGDDGGSPLRAAPPLVRVDVWIDNIRFKVSKSDVTLWEAQVLRNAAGRHATVGEDRESDATRYTFLEARFDHTHRAVSLRHKFVRSVCAMPALKYLAIAEMKVMPSRFLCAAAILGTRLCDYYFLIIAVRRRLSALNRGILLETSPTNIPPSAVGLSERLRRMIENNRKRIIKSIEKASGAIVTDASLQGWGAIFSFQTPATLTCPEESGRGSLFLSCRPRRTRYA